jgi:hypothetical protein
MPSGTQFATALVGEWNEDGGTSIQLGSVTVPASAIGLFGLGAGYSLGWPVPVWFTENQPRSEQNDGNVGLLDAGVQAGSSLEFLSWLD